MSEDQIPQFRTILPPRGQEAKGQPQPVESITITLPEEIEAKTEEYMRRRAESLAADVQRAMESRGPQQGLKEIADAQAKNEQAYDERQQNDLELIYEMVRKPGTGPEAVQKLAQEAADNGVQREDIAFMVQLAGGIVTGERELNLTEPRRDALQNLYSELRSQVLSPEERQPRVQELVNQAKALGGDNVYRGFIERVVRLGEGGVRAETY